MKLYVYYHQQTRKEFLIESIEPFDVDLSHAGTFSGITSCTDYSNLNNERKTIRIRRTDLF